VTTDYFTSVGCPQPYLRRIADAGFSHVHWCHQWNTDFLYSKYEIGQIGKWLEEYDLRLLDLHGSAGLEKNWASLREYERRAGVELVKNRVKMTAELGGDVVIMHLPGKAASEAENVERMTQARRSLDELAGSANESGVRIGIENAPGDDVERMQKLFAEYDPDFLGLCYDSGHGNLGGIGLDQLPCLADRLISVHSHDNNGSADQHKLVFSGTVDWEQLATIIAGSAYTKCLSFEVSMRESGIADEQTFLRKAYETGMKLSAMVTRAGQETRKGEEQS